MLSGELDRHIDMLSTSGELDRQISMLSSSCDSEVYAHQTKILEGRTNMSERVFEALFKGASTRLGLPNVEKCFEIAF